jgi:hypothetical protein
LDPAAIADGIISAIGRRAELSALGIEQASKFTWEACASEHVAAYHEAIARH